MLFDGTDTPTVAVELDFGAVGIFTLGISSLGGPDVLGTPTTTWTAIAATDVRAVSTRRGRTREDQAMQPGSAVITLDNRSGYYDADNPAGPYWWGQYSTLTRGLGLRITATYSAVTYVLFRGYVESVLPDLSLDPVTTITATDALAWLGSKTLATIVASYAGDTTSARAARILDAAGWSASLRSLTGTKAMLDTTYNATALALLEEVAQCEAGRVFAARTGEVTLLPYESAFTSTLRLVYSDERTTGTIEYDSIRTSPGAEYLINTVELTTTPGTVYTYACAGSAARYGTYTRAVTAPLSSGSVATAVARGLAERCAYPQARVDGIEFDAPGAGTSWPSILQADLAERATIVRNTVDGRRRTFACVIESWNHDITTDGWRVTSDLSPAAASTYFVLGTSALGGTDRLYY